MAKVIITLSDDRDETKLSIEFVPGIKNAKRLTPAQKLGYELAKTLGGAETVAAFKIWEGKIKPKPQEPAK